MIRKHIKHIMMIQTRPQDWMPSSPSLIVRSLQPLAHSPKPPWFVESAEVEATVTSYYELRKQSLLVGLQVSILCFAGVAFKLFLYEEDKRKIS